MKTLSRLPAGKLAVTYLVGIHFLLFLVLWKSDFTYRVKKHLSSLYAAMGRPTASQPLRYETLLSRFPEAHEINNSNQNRKLQPMTYGLVLSAESIRFNYRPTAEGQRRTKNAFAWLCNNSDIDGDGFPGWGLPDAWDAFGDGSVNAPNHPYTITTAICLNGLQDALMLEEFWSSSEKNAATHLLADTAIRWCRECVSDGFEGKYFWYSAAPDDDVFCPNVSAMFMGSLVRLLNERPNVFSEDEQNLVRETVSQCANALIATVRMRYGAPFWKYVARPDRKMRAKANDAVHHAYILWGIEVYREFAGVNSIPWSRNQSIESMDRYWFDGRCREFPQDVKISRKSARLWGAGMALAFHARFGDRDQSDRILASVARDYRWPDLTHRSGENSPFVPRSAAHVLFGMACHSFTAVDDQQVEKTVRDHQPPQSTAAIRMTMSRVDQNDGPDL